MRHTYQPESDHYAIELSGVVLHILWKVSKHIENNKLGFWEGN
jgi:hypothetical protein